MNFEINKDKLEQIIFKYLDNKNYDIKENDKEYVFLEKGTDYIVIMVDKSLLSCSINDELIQELKSFFSVRYQFVDEVIVKYLEGVLNMKINDSFIFLQAKFWD